MRKIFVSDIVELVSPHAHIVLRSPQPKTEVFYSGSQRSMPETWHGREVVWMLPCDGGFVLEVE